MAKKEKAESLFNGRYNLIYSPTHKRAREKSSFSGYVYEHILIAEEFMGRELREDEVVHHLDFNGLNNDPSNLLVLPLSQHTKLHRWLELNNINKDTVIETAESFKICPICGKRNKTRRVKYCSDECFATGSRKIERPTKEDLEKLILEIPLTKIGKMYGVSDSAIRKWAKGYGITKFPSNKERLRPDLNGQVKFPDFSQIEKDLLDYPMKQLSKLYNVPLKTLRRVIEENNIPKPPNGYWARLGRDK